MPILTVPDGPTLTYDDYGGDGPPILFSHGLFMNRTMFAPQIDRFKADYRCVAWDERSHGETRWSGSYSLWDSGRDQLALMDQLGIDRAILVGMSQGGLLSLRTALLAPERVVGLVMLASQAGTINPARGALFSNMAATWSHGGVPSDQTLAGISSQILGPGLDEEPWLAAWRSMPDDHVRDAVETITSREDLTAELHKITCPVLVIHGSADASTSLDRSRDVANGVPDCRGLVVIDGAPHAANLTHPHEVNAAILTFLAGLTPPAEGPSA